ncbi:MAG: 50S ribosomal protein L22 [Chloroflexia bacterium]|jgi:large subunit ribosomal protein L22|nr:50S ribosomal protein L22 [Chloroflexia bacterium]
MRVKATNKYIRSSPQKARLVLDLVRGKPVKEALSILQFTNKGVATEIAKTVKSAAANAENNYQLDRDDLYIAAIYADDGPTFKRIRPAPRGRAHQILKRTAHVTVIVDEVNQEG